MRVRGDAAFTWTEVEGSETIAAATLETGRHRLMVEGSHTRPPGVGGARHTVC